MAFQFLCPQGHMLQGDPTQAGQQCKCPYCQTEFLVPAAAVPSQAAVPPQAAALPGAVAQIGMPPAAAPPAANACVIAARRVRRNFAHECSSWNIFALLEERTEPRPYCGPPGVHAQARAGAGQPLDAHGGGSVCFPGSGGVVSSPDGRA